MLQIFVRGDQSHEELIKMPSGATWRKEEDEALCHVNVSSISAKERAEAERRYIKNVARDLLFVSPPAENGAVVASTNGSGESESAQQDGSNNKDAILVMHPLFDELVKKHGESMISVTSSKALSGGGKLANDTISVTIRSLAPSSCTMEPLRKRLPGSMKVERLKIMCSRAFQLDTDLQMLHFRTEVSGMS